MKKLWTTSSLIAGLACAALFCSCSSGDSSSSPDSDEPVVESSSAEDGVSSTSSSSVKQQPSSSSKKNSSGDDSGETSSSDSNGSADDVQKTVSSSSSDVVVKPISKEACSLLTDAENATLQNLSYNTVNLLRNFVENDIDAMAPAATYKEKYKALLDKYGDGSVCPIISLGYGITFLADVLNNQTVQDLRQVLQDYKSPTSGRLFTDKFITSMLETVRRTSVAYGSSFTAESQKALRNIVIPALDSAIGYYAGIVKASDYVYEIETDDYMVQLDQSDFSTALGLMYAAKGLFVAVSSINLEIGKNGDYQWIVDYSNANGYSYSTAQIEAYQYVATLLSGATGLTSVIPEYKDAWKSVPNILRSATTYIRKGLQHSLNDDDQDFDMFVVGDDSNADFSSAKIQQFVHAVDAVEEALDGNYSYEYEKGKSVTFNLKNFFAQTNGFMQYMPQVSCDDYGCYFVDLSGNKTINVSDARSGMVRGFEAQFFYFKDPTLGGVFPKFTQSAIWDFINSFKD